MLTGAAALALTQLTFAQETRRIEVEVSPVELSKRAEDEMPARLDLNFKEILKGGRADFDTLKIRAASGDTGPIAFRWYDADVPENFPEFHSNISRTNGEIRSKPAKMAGHFYNTSGSGERGFLAFTHTQRGNAAGKYIIEFKLLPEGKPVEGNGPKGWIGDGQSRCGPIGESTTGSGHTRIAVDDWNDDGLPDIIHGEEYGTLFILPNVGTKSEPRFTYRKFLVDAKGAPIDVGMHAAPLVTDFDGDGVKDLLIGTHVDRLVWFKNTGTNQDRKLEFKGYVHAAGAPLSLPAKPIINRSEDVFKHDYYPIVDYVDWDADGKKDLIAGGYVTGRIYLLKNTGNNPDGTPALDAPVPLQADGRVLNVRDWCAAPSVADLDGDGLLDIVSGRLPFSEDSKADEAMLYYFEGAGSPTSLALQKKALPQQGTFPGPSLSTPRAADMNGDGVLDLVVSAREQIWIYYNRGTKTAPKFEAHNKPILLPWSSDSITTSQFIDYNRDGLPDLFYAYKVSLNTGKPAPFSFGTTTSVLPANVRIEHPSKIGDDWFYPYLTDFDGDGDFDVLFGDWFGTVWLHRNNGDDKSPKYDRDGFRLKTSDGAEIKVGPINVDPAKDFGALQGARTVMAAGDIDGDGTADLIVGDTYGIVRYYRNTGTKADPVFEPAMEVGSVKTRCSVDITDWDEDGRLDVIAGSAGGMVRVFMNRNAAGKVKFDEGIDPGLPPIKQPRVIMVDLNGDGDQDLYVPGTQGSIWIERSFLRHGYAKAKVTKVD